MKLKTDCIVNQSPEKEMRSYLGTGKKKFLLPIKWKRLLLLQVLAMKMLIGTKTNSCPAHTYVQDQAWKTN